MNEGAHILEEGIALRASDIDVVYLAGYGFPAAARRPDVLCQPRRARAGRAAHEGIRGQPARRSGVLEAGEAARAARGRGQTFDDAPPRRTEEGRQKEGGRRG